MFRFFLFLLALAVGVVSYALDPIDRPVNQTESEPSPLPALHAVPQSGVEPEHNQGGTVAAPITGAKRATTAPKDHPAHDSGLDFGDLFDEPQWTYSGATGPAHWAELSPDYALCGEGKRQSPIDITHAYVGQSVRSPYTLTGLRYEPLARLRLIYYASALRIINTGHTIQVRDVEGSYFRVGSHRFSLLQFHFHTPSEHHIAGHSYPMELHLVHRENNALAVIAVFITEGAHNRSLQTILNNLPKQIGEESAYKVLKVNPADLLPNNKGYYQYEGSLTTPPCREGVAWYVLKQPIAASKRQIKRFRELMHDNARPVQPKNDRFVFQTSD